MIIPTFNEAGIVQNTIRAVAEQQPHEIIVADGGSRDRTLPLALEIPGVQAVTSMRGRANQMNTGARASTGDVLLFLHADTALPAKGVQIIDETMADTNIAGGRFRVSFDEEDYKYRLMAYYTRFRIFSYGDQAFFVRRSVFHAIHGFDPEASFEDVDFFRRLRKQGKVKILKSNVTTSARRFRKNGFARQKLINVGLSLMEGVGISPKPLMKKFYPHVR